MDDFQAIDGRTVITSDTHPIRVDFLPKEVVGLPGRLGMTHAPGKQNQGTRATWERDLEKDLIRLRKYYGAELLITLLEAHELEFLQIPELLTQIQQYDIQSRWFPIQDFSVPTSMQALIDLVQFILTAAQQPQTIVIHCRAGLGRTGLVAAACLVARGYSPEDAFAHIRAVRSGSVETPK